MYNMLQRLIIYIEWLRLQSVILVRPYSTKQVCTDVVYMCTRTPCCSALPSLGMPRISKLIWNHLFEAPVPCNSTEPFCRQAVLCRAAPYWATANLRTKILDFRGFDSSKILISRGRILMAIGGFPGKLESTNLSREILSKEIGRTPVPRCAGPRDADHAPSPWTTIDKQQKQTAQGQSNDDKTKHALQQRKQAKRQTTYTTQTVRNRPGQAVGWASVQTF